MTTVIRETSSGLEPFDVERARRDFPILRREAEVDHVGSARPARRVEPAAWKMLDQRMLEPLPERRQTGRFVGQPLGGELERGRQPHGAGNV